MEVAPYHADMTSQAFFFFFAEAKFGITSDKGMVGTVFFYEVIYSF
jgi:hypothetical protein